MLPETLNGPLPLTLQLIFELLSPSMTRTPGDVVVGPSIKLFGSVSGTVLVRDVTGHDLPAMAGEGLRRLIRNPACAGGGTGSLHANALVAKTTVKDNRKLMGAVLRSTVS